MTQITQDPGRCRTHCECGMCGLPVRLVPGDTRSVFDIKAGDVLLMSVSISRVRRPREQAVMVGDLSGRVPFSAAQRLSPEKAIQFIQDLGIPDEFFKSALVDLGWIEPLDDCEPPDDWLEEVFVAALTELANGK